MLFGGAHDVRLDLGVDVVQDGLEETSSSRTDW
jgi:hypothetical protein